VQIVHVVAALTGRYLEPLILPVERVAPAPDIFHGRKCDCPPGEQGRELLVVKDVFDQSKDVQMMIKSVARAVEEVDVREPSYEVVSAPADAKVDHQAVVDPNDPVRMDRVRQGDLSLDEIDVVVGLEDLEALVEVVLEELVVAVEEKDR